MDLTLFEVSFSTGGDDADPEAAEPARGEVPVDDRGAGHSGLDVRVTDEPPADEGGSRLPSWALPAAIGLFSVAVSVAAALLATKYLGGDDEDEAEEEDEPAVAEPEMGSVAEESADGGGGLRSRVPFLG